jgi:CubicO group peptidase (beta-lactamase class C family)
MKLLICAVAAALSFAPAVAAPATPLPLAAAPAQGMAAARLERLDGFLRARIDRGDYLGAVALVARDGKIVHWQAYGQRDLARTQPLARDAIFRIYSMSKTVTTVAVLALMEEGKLSLEDPVGKYLPAFGALRVFTGGSADAPATRAAARPVTIRQLLTHTSGFAVDGKDGDPARALLERARLAESPDLADYAARLARLPLAHEPGTEFHYDGVQIVLLSRLVEVVAGMPFAQFLQQRIFDPLRMVDTGFTVAPAQRARIAAMTTTGADGKLAAPAAGTLAAPGLQLNPYTSGAGGLYSTAGDYARFAQMLLNGGALDGADILGPKTVELMMQNHLSQLTPPVTEFSAAEGFGLGGSVLLDVARRGRPGSVGQFGWSGAASTYFTIDRRERLVAILLLQHLPQGLPTDPPTLSVPFYNLVYQAIAK